MGESKNLEDVIGSLQHELAISDATVEAMGSTIEGTHESEALHAAVARLESQCRSLEARNRALQAAPHAAVEETRRLRGVIATLEETNATQAEALLEAETAAKLAGTAMGHQALYLEEAETAAKLAGNAITELEEEGIHQTQELREKLDAAERAADAALDAKSERMGAALEVVGAMRQWHEESTSP